MASYIKKGLKKISNFFNSKKSTPTSKKKITKPVTKKKKVTKKVVKKTKPVTKKKKDVKKKNVNRVIKKTKPVIKKKKDVKKVPKARKKISRKKLLEKSIINPILEPNKYNNWESWQTFNPASVYIDNKVHFLYRAIGDGGISTLGYAVSDDPEIVKDRLSKPAYILSDYFFNKLKKDKKTKFFNYSSGGSTAGCEDPRITLIDNKIYLIHTTFSNWLYLRMTLTSINKDDFVNKKWHKWKKPVFISAPGQVHKNWVIFPEKIQGQYAILTSISPKISISYFDNLNFNGREFINSEYKPKSIKNSWEEYRRGVGPPPIKTKAGWLLFYHAVEKNDTSKYKIGAMILDYKNPEKILYTSKEPVLEPDMVYENNGFKPGIVYSCGTVLINDTLYIYYGGADTVVCVASAPLNKFVDSIISGQKSALKKKKVLKNK